MTLAQETRARGRRKIQRVDADSAREVFCGYVYDRSGHLEISIAKNSISLIVASIDPGEAREASSCWPHSSADELLSIGRVASTLDRND